MEFKNENGTLTLFLEGRIDSTNASDIESEIDKIKSENTFESLIIDCDKLLYISSAGLRIILRLLKSNTSLKLVNVSSEVYDVFEMTGFTDMVSIEKGYRHISIEGCEVIGEGSNGKVYRTDRDTIVKVYKNPDSLEDIKHERELARKAFVLGIPTAIPFDVVKVGNTYGSVFELLNAKSFVKLVNENPNDFDKYIDLSVDLLKKIHSAEVEEGDMPNMKEVVLDWGSFMKDYLSTERYNKLMKMINDIPYNRHMIHGDYHFKNIMMQNDEVLLIDMDTLCFGNPVFEFASIFNAYVGFNIYKKDTFDEFLGLSYEQTGYIWNQTLKLYFKDKEQSEIDKMAKQAELIGFIRLVRRSYRRGLEKTEDGKGLIDESMKKIEEYIDTLDTLAY